MGAETPCRTTSIPSWSAAAPPARRFIATDDPPDLDSSVTMQFSLPGDPGPIKVGGRVTRVSEGQDGEPRGIGVEFDTLDPEARDRVNGLVQALRARS
jgi:Tfp pilus assembly protein PilZ